MVSVPLALLTRCRPRSLPGVRPRPRSRVTLWRRRSLMATASRAQESPFPAPLPFREDGPLPGIIGIRPGSFAPPPDAPAREAADPSLARRVGVRFLGAGVVAGLLHLSPGPT